MAESAFLLIAGNGKSSRLNIEALLNDYIVLLKQQSITPVVVPIVQTRASEEQLYAAQFAKDKGIDCVTYTTDEASMNAFPSSSFIQVNEPLKEACKLVKGDAKAYGFLLWDDEDQLSADALATFSSKGIGCYDLTNGLTDITPVKGLKAVKKPVQMPKEETVGVIPLDQTPKASTDLLEPEEEDDEEEYTDAEEAFMDEFYSFALTFADLIAQRVVERMEKR
jgi:hypothetical protein